MNIYEKLISNSFIFALGNLGTKLIVFFLVPLHTYYLTTNEYGTVDLITTTVNLLLPIITLSIYDSVLRFVMDRNYEKQIVLNNAFVIIIIGYVILLTIYPLFYYLFPFNDNLIYFYVLILFQALFTTLSQYVRAQGMVKLFAISGILNAFVLLVLNLILLVILELGITGYLLAIIISNVISISVIIIIGKVFKDFSIKKIEVSIVSEMLRYSIPLIPNSLMWWIMGFSDRFIITSFLGIGANGLYAVANKIPSLLNIINTIFFQAWQMSAIEEANSKDKSNFFSNVFNVFSMVMLLSTSLLLVHLKHIIELLVAEPYIESWKYVPFLLLGIVFSSFSGFLGTNYIAEKKTTGVFKTSLIGAIINIVLNLLLIPLLGLNGAAIATMISFLIIWIIRIYDTKKFVTIRFNLKKFIFSLAILLLQVALLYQNIDHEYLIQLGLLFILLITYLKEIKYVFNKMIRIILRV